MAWCLPKYLTSDFLNKLRDKTINPEKLMNMTSDERRKFFDDNFGEEHGKDINRTFESKLLLKNQQQGIINWAKDMAGLKPEAQKDLISKVNKMTNILNPENEKEFLKDYAGYKLGTNVTLDEAKNISELSKIASEKKEALNNGGDKMDYGYARVDLQNYLNDLKTNVKTIGETVKDITKHPGRSIADLSGVAKSAKVTMTNAIVRHGLWTAVDSPEVWYRNSLKTFKDIYDSFGGKAVMDNVNADKFSRDNYLNGAYAKDKLAVGVTEEALPNSETLQKIPYLGRVQKAFGDAFSAFQMRNRMDLYDKFHEILEDRYGEGEGTGKGAGVFANSLTVRGDLGKYEGSGADLVNKVFFSPRYVKSQFDNLTAQMFNSKIDPFLKKRAAVNLVKYISGMAAVITAVNKLRPGTVEYNPFKPNFGVVKVGNTRFDMTAGMKSMVVLAAKLSDVIARNTGAYKKAKDYGVINKIPAQPYKSGVGGGVDLVKDFARNKLSPASSLFYDILSGHNYDMTKISVGSEAKNMFEPIPVQSYEQLSNDPNSANIVLSMIADGLGITVTDYPPTKPKAGL